MASLTNLPRELIIEILTNLDYLALNIQIRAVSKLFNAIIKEKPPTLQAILFRRRQLSASEREYKQRGNQAGVEKRAITDESEPLQGGRDLFKCNQQCFQLHPHFGSLVIDMQAVREDGFPFGAEQIGFVGKSGNFTPLNLTWVAEDNVISLEGSKPSESLLELIPKEKCKNYGNIQTDYLPLRVTQSDLPLIITAGPHTFLDSITVKELVDRMLDLRNRLSERRDREERFTSLLGYNWPGRKRSSFHVKGGINSVIRYISFNISSKDEGGSKEEKVHLLLKVA